MTTHDNPELCWFTGDAEGPFDDCVACDGDERTCPGFVSRAEMRELEMGDITYHGRSR